MGHFIAAVIFFQILPLTPLWFEFKHTGDIKMDSYILCVSVYCFAIGFSSKNIGQLAICFLIGLLQAGSYSGDTTSTAFELQNLTNFSLLLVFIMHLVERYKRHVEGNEPFLTIDK